MVMKLWTGYWDNHLERIEVRVDEDNKRALGMGKVGIRKAQRFSINEFWKNIGCLVLSYTFVIGGSILWKNEEEKYY